jgi:hypothetical protein
MFDLTVEQAFAYGVNIRTDVRSKKVAKHRIGVWTEYTAENVSHPDDTFCL